MLLQILLNYFQAWFVLRICYHYLLFAFFWSIYLFNCLTLIMKVHLIDIILYKSCSPCLWNIIWFGNIIQNISICFMILFLKHLFKIVDPSEKLADLELVNCFITCLLNSVTIFPVRWTAKEYFEPVIDGVFDIFKKVHIFFLDSISFHRKIIISYFKLISVLIEWHHKDRNETQNNSK